MKPRRCLLLALGLLAASGCGLSHRLPLSEEYRSIELGQPLPAEANCTPGVSREQVHTWPRGTGATEKLGCVLDADGLVAVKTYHVAGEEGALLTLWYKRRERTEWDIAVGPAMDDDQNLLGVLHDGCRKVAFVTDGQAVDALLDLAAKNGGLADSDFRVRRTTDVNLFPAMTSTRWLVERTGEGSFHLLVEKRKDMSLIVWAVSGWLNWLATGSIH